MPFSKGPFLWVTFEQRTEEGGRREGREAHTDLGEGPPSSGGGRRHQQEADVGVAGGDSPAGFEEPHQVTRRLQLSP